MNPVKPPPGEEPELTAEDDIPTEDAPEDAPVEADDESVAGEEDPGAALDTERAKPRSRAAG